MMSLPPAMLVLAGIWLAAAGPATGIAAAKDGPDRDPLAPHRWTSRLLVLIAPEVDDPRAVEQRRLFTVAAPGNSARDLLLVAFEGKGRQAVAVRDRFDVPPGAFRAILVGKDGMPKIVSAGPIPTDRLFREIDAMPMRRDEARRRGR